MRSEELRYPEEKRHYDRARSFFDPAVAALAASSAGREYRAWLGTMRAASKGRGAGTRAGTALARALAEARSALETGRPIEVFVDDTPSAPARAVLDPEDGRWGAIVVSEEALASLDEDELAFALGHEIAHLELGHGALRCVAEAVFAEGKGMPPLMHREYRVWSALAEYSCDRAGAALAGGAAAGAAALRKLSRAGRDIGEDRIGLLEDPGTFPAAYRRLIGGGPCTSSDAHARFLLSAGLVVASADGAVSGGDLAYIGNRLSRLMYLGPEEERLLAGLGPLEAEEMMASSARLLAKDPATRVDAAFLDLAVLAMRDGVLAEGEYRRLRDIGERLLGMKTAEIEDLCLRVVGSGYYRPWSEA